MMILLFLIGFIVTALILITDSGTENTCDTTDDMSTLLSVFYGDDCSNG